MAPPNEEYQKHNPATILDFEIINKIVTDYGPF